MLSGQGWTAIAGCRQFFYARYVDWFITMPLIILTLGLVAGQDFVTLAAVVGADSEFPCLRSGILVCGVWGCGSGDKGGGEKSQRQQQQQQGSVAEWRGLGGGIRTAAAVCFETASFHSRSSSHQDSGLSEGNVGSGGFYEGMTSVFFVGREIDGGLKCAVLMIVALYMGAVSVVTTVKWFWFLFAIVSPSHNLPRRFVFCSNDFVRGRSGFRWVPRSRARFDRLFPNSESVRSMSHAHRVEHRQKD
eukprot:1184429-Rhodomonas_salina.1